MADPPATRDLVLGAVVLVGLSRFVDGTAAWLVAVLLLLAVALGALQVLADSGPASASAAGIPIEHLIGPATAAAAGLGAIRLVPLGVAVLPALLLVGWLMSRVLSTEARILSSTGAPSAAERTAVLVEALVIGFLGFAGVAALVPGGLAEPSIRGVGVALAGRDLAMLAIADGVLAFLLGYRATALRTTSPREVLASALTYGAAVGIAAVALRAMAVPRLAGPALLVVVFFLWDAIHGAPVGRRRDARRIWEILLLVVLGAVVVAWSVGLRDV